MTDPTMKRLDGLLDEVASHRPDVPDALMSAVLRDAALAMPRPAPRPGWREILMDMVGGWPAVGGMAAAGVAGLWLGIAPPVALETATVELFGTTETVDLFGPDPLSVFAVEEQAQ